MIPRSTRLFFFGFFLFSFLSATLPLPAEAALVPCGRSSGTAAEQAPCTVCHLVVGGKGVIDYGLKIMTFVAIAVIVAMAIFYIVSTGDEGMMQTAKSGIKAALIGFAVMLGAWLIVNTTLRILSANISGLTVSSSGFSFTCDTSSSAGSATSNTGGTGIGNTASGVIVVPATGGTISVPIGSSVLFISAAKITVSSAALITQSNSSTQPVAVGSTVTVPAGARLSFPAGAATLTLPQGGTVTITAGGTTAGGNPTGGNGDSCPTGYTCESSSCSGISGDVCNDGFGICCKPNTGGGNVTPITTQPAPVPPTPSLITPFLEIVPTSLTLTSSTEQKQLIAYFTDSSGTKTDVTNKTQWSTAATANIILGTDGTVMPGTSNGNAQITALYKDTSGTNYTSTLNILVNIPSQQAQTPPSSCTKVGGNGPVTFVVTGSGFPNTAAGTALFNQQVDKIKNLNKPPLIPSAYTMYRSDTPNQNTCGASDIQVIIYNSPTVQTCYGGGSYVFLTGFPCVTEEIFAHELGHAIGNLGEEYEATASLQPIPASVTPLRNCVNVPATPSSAGNTQACDYFNTNFGSNQCFQGCYFGASSYRWRDASNDIMRTPTAGNQFGPADKALISNGLQRLGN